MNVWEAVGLKGCCYIENSPSGFNTQSSFAICLTDTHRMWLVITQHLTLNSLIQVCVKSKT